MTLSPTIVGSGGIGTPAVWPGKIVVGGGAILLNDPRWTDAQASILTAGQRAKVNAVLTYSFLPSCTFADYHGFVHDPYCGSGALTIPAGAAGAGHIVHLRDWDLTPNTVEHRFTGGCAVYGPTYFSTATVSGQSTETTYPYLKDAEAGVTPGVINGFDSGAGAGGPSLGGSTVHDWVTESGWGTAGHGYYFDFRTNIFAEFCASLEGSAGATLDGTVIWFDAV